jgi:hypothetical protein
MSSNAIGVHSVQEEYFYLMVHPCACGGPWFSDEQNIKDTRDQVLHDVKARCAACGKERTFHFELPDRSKRDRSAPVRQINPTAEPSRAVDLAEWMDLARFYLARIERLKAPVERAQSLLDARQCLEEALKFYGPEDDAPPPEALWSGESQRKVTADPDAYRRGALEAMLEKMPSRNRLRQADAPDQREFEKALKEEARRRVGRRWWQLWKRRNA